MSSTYKQFIRALLDFDRATHLDSVDEVIAGLRDALPSDEPAITLSLIGRALMEAGTASVPQFDRAKAPYGKRK